MLLTVCLFQSKTDFLWVKLSEWAHFASSFSFKKISKNGATLAAVRSCKYVFNTRCPCWFFVATGDHCRKRCTTSSRAIIGNADQLPSRVDCDLDAVWQRCDDSLVKTKLVSLIGSVSMTTGSSGQNWKMFSPQLLKCGTESFRPAWHRHCLCLCLFAPPFFFS